MLHSLTSIYLSIESHPVPSWSHLLFGSFFDVNVEEEEELYHKVRINIEFLFEIFNDRREIIMRFLSSNRIIEIIHMIVNVSENLNTVYKWFRKPIRRYIAIIIVPNSDFLPRLLSFGIQNNFITSVLALIDFAEELHLPNNCNL